MSVQPRYRAEAYLPRHAFDPCDRARAADLWRAFQELAVGASTERGWPPARYREHGCAFVMRSMRVVHHRRATYGESFAGESWVRRMRREMLSTREVRLTVATSGEDLPLASGTQEWVHVNAQMKPARGDASLISAFQPVDSDTVEVPTWSPLVEGQKEQSSFEFDIWNTWMDPLGHVNHPQYLDFAEEGLMRVLRLRGVEADTLRPRAESVTFFRGLVAGERARVRTSIVGTSTMGVVSEHLIERAEDGLLCARAELHREY